MSFVILLIYAIICYGIANTVIFANGPFHIFVKMHNIAAKIHPQLEEMLSCFICSGWWIGFIMSGINLYFFPWMEFTPMSIVGFPLDFWYITMFLDGAFTSGMNWLIHTTQEAIESIKGKSDE